MATSLLEKRLLDYKDKKTKNLSLDELFVSYYINTGSGIEFKTKKLSELFIKVKKGDKESVRPVSSFNEYVKELANDNVYVEKSGQQSIKGITNEFPNYSHRFEPYYESFTVSEEYESTESLDKTDLKNGKTVVESSAVPYGMSRTMKVQENELSNDDNYLMMTFDGSTKQEFYKKSEIYYKDGASLVRLYEPGKKVDFTKVKGKTLYVGNRIIDSLYTEKEFSFTEYQKFDKLNVEELQRNSYEIVKDLKPEEIKEKIASGEVVELDGKYYKKTKSIQDERYYTEQTHKIITVPDPKKPGKTKEEAYYSVKTYSVDNSGNFIQLKVKGGNKVEMIDIASICDEAGNPIEKDNIKYYVGKSIKIKTSDNLTLETEPLTFEQANYFYDKHYNYEPSISKEDILADNAYLQTKDGQFVQETNVAPISYKFTKNDKCDAYLVRIETADGIQEKVVKAEEFAKVHKKYNIKAAYNLETCSFGDAEIVQTTTNAANNKASIEDCRVLKSYNGEKDVFEDLTSEQLGIEKQALIEKFKEAYLNGQYNVDHVYIDGKKIELDERLKRFIYTDEHLMKDFAADTLAYSGLEKSSVTYESKDGMPGKFKGNAKLSFGKVCKKAYSIWAKSLVYYIAISMSGAGLLAALAAPAVVVAAAGALIAAPVLIPPIAAIACLVKNVLNRPFKDKTKYNRKKWNKNFEKELAFVNENMKETDLTKGYSKEAFLAKMNSLRADALASSKTTVGSGFKCIDGRVVVDGENVNQVKKFKKENKSELRKLKSKEKELKRANNRVKKLGKSFVGLEEDGMIINPDNSKYKAYKEAQRVRDDIKSDYENQKSRFDNRMASYTGTATTYDKDAKVDNNLKRVDRLKNFWLVKRFTSNEELLELGFTEEEIKDLKDLKYDPSKDVFVTKQGEYVADTIKPKVELYTETVIIPEAEEKTVTLLTKLKDAMDKQGKQIELPVEENEDVVEEVVEEPKPVVEEVEKSKGAGKQVDEQKDKQPPVEVGTKPVKPKKKMYDTKIVSEDILVKFLKSKPENKERQKLIKYISEKVGVEIQEKDIEATIKRINEKHNPKKGEGKSATTGAAALKNQNIYNILSLGQQYLTEYAKEIKQRTSRPVKQDKEEDVELERRKSKYIEDMKSLENKIISNESRIRSLKQQQERNKDALVVIKGAFAYLEEKQEYLKLMDEKIGSIYDKINEAKQNKINAKTQKEKDDWQAQIDAIEQDLQRHSSSRAEYYEKKCYAEGELEKILKQYGYEGKSLEEIIQIMNSLQVDIEELLKDNDKMQKKLDEINEKYKATFKPVHLNLD